MGDFIVIAVLAIVVFFCARSIYKSKKNNKGGCNGNCGSCSGCH